MIARRNTDRPLYLWIREYKSVLNIGPKARLEYHISGASIVRKVLHRYVRRFPTSPIRFATLAMYLVDRYRSTHHALGLDISKIIHAPEDYFGIIKIEQEHPMFAPIFCADKNPSEDQLKSAEYLAAMKHKTEMAEHINKFFSRDWAKRYKQLCAPVDVPWSLRKEVVIEIPAGHPPGVYFLLHEEEVVYVGQSTSPGSRIAQHTKDKIFDRVLLIPTNDLDNVEAKYIKKFQPKYNVMLK